MGQFYYIKDTSKSLTPLFSPSMVNALFYSICIAVCFLLGFWPQSAVSRYFRTGDLPMNSLMVFSAVLIMLTIIAVRSGSGEMTHHDLAAAIDFKRIAPELQSPFITHGFIRFLIQNLLVISPFLPVFVLSITLSAVAVSEFLKLLLTVYQTTLICRLFSFHLFLHFGSDRIKGFFFNLFFLIIFFIITFFLYAPLNPLFQVYGSSMRYQSSADSFFSVWELYMVVTSVMIVVLALSTHIVVTRKRPEEFL
ncbi:hypothetical protein KJ966_22870 [bacterium]|nr:hypothetical protein [bacterium]